MGKKINYDGKKNDTKWLNIFRKNVVIENYPGYTLSIVNSYNLTKFRIVFTFGLLNASSVHIIEGNMST